MSSEEMRTELETFVNEGLREGWRGWPRHEGRSFRGTDRTEGTNRTHGAGRDLGFLDRSYESYRSN
jgi:hypothetical protein